ncbi:hypothetical protein DFA_02344 [Cavenderia fasciculata]|uniref:Uncharacterized protein n=1 Tax=Cavenderia fasciculata TaxID=261658 RepID=F4PZ69_CACFS|nr:uncharacterized protein DFA_02344 [Cavenderia fasciculata]EGG19098.1 hypothetical protein DFA_02344 [Cavenderia fasciculata]|eukprot:XP_004366731.1 hypothetical protein DFA_02344 [Cavenderia fasciculata]
MQTHHTTILPLIPFSWFDRLDEIKDRFEHPPNLQHEFTKFLDHLLHWTQRLNVTHHDHFLGLPIVQQLQQENEDEEPQHDEDEEDTNHSPTPAQVIDMFGVPDILLNSAYSPEDIDNSLTDIIQNRMTQFVVQHDKATNISPSINSLTLVHGLLEMVAVVESKNNNNNENHSENNNHNENNNENDNNNNNNHNEINNNNNNNNKDNEKIEIIEHNQQKISQVIKILEFNDSANLRGVFKILNKYF